VLHVFRTLVDRNYHSTHILSEVHMYCLSFAFVMCRGGRIIWHSVLLYRRQCGSHSYFHGCTDNSRVRKEELPLSMLGRYVRGEVTVHSFLTPEADGCDWYTSCPCRFGPGKEAQYPLHKRLLGPHNMSGLIWERKILPHAGIRAPDLFENYSHSSVVPYTLKYNMRLLCCILRKWEVKKYTVFVFSITIR